MKRLATVLLLSAGVLGLLLLLAVTQEWIGSPIARQFLSRISTGGGAVVTARDVRFHGLSGMTAYGVRWSRGDTLLASADTLEVAWAGTRVLGRTLDLEHAHVAGGVVDPRALRSWLVSRAASREARTGSRAPADLRVGRIRIARARLLPGALDPLPASSAALGESEWNATLEGLVFRSGRLTIRDARIEATAGLGPAGLPGRLTLRGSWDAGRLEIPELALDTPRSRVTGRLRQNFGAIAESPGELSLVIERLAPDELRPFLGLADTTRVAGLDAAPDAVITGTAALQGDRPDRWSGPVRLRATGLRPGGVTLDSVSVELDFVEGWGRARVGLLAGGRPPGWRVDARVAAEGAWADSSFAGPLRIDAGAAHLEAEGRVDLRGGLEVSLASGRFGGVDPALLAPGAPAGALAGRFTLSWEARGAAAIGRLTLELDPSTLAGHPLDGGDATLSLADGRLQGSASLRSAGAEIRVTEGWIEPGTTWRVELPRVQVRHLDPRRFAPARDSALAGDWNGRLALAVSLRPQQFPAPGTSWGGAIARGAIAGVVRLELDPSRARALEIRGGRVDATITPGEITADAALETAAGDATLRGALTDPGGGARWRIDALGVRGLDLSLLPFAGLPVTALTANLSAAGSGLTPAALRLSGAYTVAPSRWSDTAVDGGSGTLELRDGIAIVDGRLALGWGTVTFAGSHDRGEHPPRTTFGATVGLTELLSLTRRPLPDTDGEIVVTGDGHGSDLAHWTGSVDLIGSGRLGRARIPQLRLPIRVADGIATLDSVDFVAPWASLSGAGSVVFADSTGERLSDLVLALRVEDARPLAGVVGLDTLAADTLTLRVAARGPARALTVDLAFDAAGLRAGPARLRSGTATATARLGGAEGRLVSGATARVVLLEPRWGAFRSRELSLDIVDDGTATRWTLEHESGDGPRMQAAARLEVNGGVSTLTLEALDLTGPRATWALAAPAVIRVSPGRARVDTLSLVSGDGTVTVTGGLDARGVQDLSLRLESFPLAGIAALNGRPDLDGTLSADVEVRGAASAPEVRGRLGLDARRSGRALGRLEARVESTAGHLVVDARLAPNSGAPLLVSGSVPFRIVLDPDSTSLRIRGVATGESYELTLRSEGLDLEILPLVVDPGTMRLEGGRLALDTRIRGAAAAPTAEGPMELTARGFQLPALGLDARDLTSSWTLGGGRLRLTRLAARAGGGTLSGDGELGRDAAGRLEWTLRADLSRFQVAEARDWKARLSGSGTVAGHGDTLRVAGAFEAHELEYFFTPTGAGVLPAEVALTDADYRMLERTFGEDFRRARPAELWWQLLGLDLDLTLGRNSWYRQRGEPRMAVELTGPLAVEKAPGGPLLLRGRLEPIAGRGFVEQFGRRFDVKGGVITLEGDPLALDLDVRTEYQTPPSRDTGEAPVTVSMNVKGTLDRLDLEFSSDPPLTNSEIVSVIATGTPGGVNPTASGNNGNDAAGTAAQIGLSRLTGAVEELAERNIGLDVVQIRQDGLRGATLVAGKYLSSRVYIGFRQPVSFETQTTENSAAGRQPLFELEYSAWRWLLLNLQGEGSRFQGFLRGRHAF